MYARWGNVVTVYVPPDLSLKPFVLQLFTYTELTGLSLAFLRSRCWNF